MGRGRAGGGARLGVDEAVGGGRLAAGAGAVVTPVAEFASAPSSAHLREGFAAAIRRLCGKMKVICDGKIKAHCGSASVTRE